jgi:hypothetical protein
MLQLVVQLHVVLLRSRYARGLEASMTALLQVTLRAITLRATML